MVLAAAVAVVVVKAVVVRTAVLAALERCMAAVAAEAVTALPIPALAALPRLG